MWRKYGAFYYLYLCKVVQINELISNTYYIEREVNCMQIDKVQLLILSILDDLGANTPGTGMTLREIANEVNKCDDHKYSQITINRKVWALRDNGYVTSKIKTNKADMFFITSSGKSIKEVLFDEE